MYKCCAAGQAINSLVCAHLLKHVSGTNPNSRNPNNPICIQQELELYRLKAGTGEQRTDHGNMVKVVDEKDGAQLLGLEGARQLHEQVHAGVPHPVQVVVQLPILRQSMAQL